MIGTHEPAAASIMPRMLGAEIVAICGLPLEPLLMTFRRAGAVVIARGVDLVFFLPVLITLIHLYGLRGIGPANIGCAIVLVLMQLAMAWHARRALASGDPRSPIPDTPRSNPA